MDYIIPAFSMLAIDSLYLRYIGGPIFQNTIKNIQGEKLKLNNIGAIGSYILLILVLYKFIIMEKKPLSDAFILGICVYGIFDFTNLAIFKNYDYFAAITDTIWGGILFYTVTYITYKLLNIKIK
jgi:uncharacterized membrane protein